MIVDRALAPAGDKKELLDAGGFRLLDRVMDERLVDDRQHFLRHRLGRGQKASAQPGDRENGFADTLMHEPLDHVLRRPHNEIYVIAPRPANYVARRANVRGSQSVRKCAATGTLGGRKEDRDGRRRSDRQPALHSDSAASAREEGGVGHGRPDRNHATPGRAVVGLSWPNLARALGRPADPRRWAVLFLGSVRPASFGLSVRSSRWIVMAPPRRTRRRCSVTSMAPSARRQLERSEGAMVAQSMASQTAPASARSAAPVTLQSGPPRTPVRGAVDDRGRRVAAEACRGPAGH